MNEFFLSSLSKALNAYLALDPESTTRLTPLAGNIVTVEMRPFHFTFQCHFTTQGIDLQSGDTQPATTIIKGTPLQMLGAMLFKEKRQRFFAEDLSIEGNADIGLQLVELFDAMQIDWEEHVASITGDIPAHHLGRIAGGARRWFNRLGNSFTQNVNEYIQEEKNWLPSREALQDFFNDIDTLRMDVDRASAKLNRLKTLYKKDEPHS